MKLAGKVAVITGASMGIGEAIAKRFAAEGASVMLCSRDHKRCEEARVRIGHPDRTLAWKCDVRDRGQIDAAVQAALARFGRIDIWVNNAGHGLLDAVATMDMAACRSMFETNLFGTIECMQAVLPEMKKQGNGTIINIASVAGHIPVPYMAAYCASKHAMIAMGKGMRMELRGSGINVLTVCPGYIQTDFGVNAVKGEQIKRLSGNAKRIGPDRVARAVLKGYLKGKRELVVPIKDWTFIKAYQFWPQLVEAVLVRVAKKSSARQIAATEGAKS